jgi:hypothetical protein
MSQYSNSNEQDVLFQKLGETWYAFTEVKGEIIFSQLPPGIDPYKTKIELFEVVENHLKRVAEHLKDDSMAA